MSVGPLDVGFVEGVVVALCLHIQTLYLVLVVEAQGWYPTTYGLVVQVHAELVKSGVFDSMVVAIEPMEHVRCCDVVESRVVGCCGKLHTLSNHVAIKLHQEPSQRKIFWWDETFELWVVHVPETVVT